MVNLRISKTVLPKITFLTALIHLVLLMVDDIKKNIGGISYSWSHTSRKSQATKPNDLSKMVLKCLFGLVALLNQIIITSQGLDCGKNVPFSKATNLSSLHSLSNNTKHSLNYKHTFTYSSV